MPPESRLRDLLIEALPLAFVLSLGAFMVVRDGGFSPTVWYPIALLLLAFSVTVVLGGGRLIGGLQPLTIGAIAALAAFSAWSYATIDWAAVRGAALQGSDRNLLYLMVFALLASWPVRGRAVWPLLLAVGLVVAGEGVVTVEQAVNGSNLGNFLIGSRLSEPLGYPNATAALFMVMAWLMIGLASRSWIPAPARGLAFGLAGLDLTLNLLTESRGSIFTLPLVALTYLALVPGRLRSLAALALVGLGMAPVIGAVLSVYDAGSDQVRGSLRHAIELGLVWALLLAVAGWLFAACDDRVRFSRRTTRTAGIAVSAATVLALLGGIVVVKPWNHVASAWRSFKYGGEPSGAASHFGGLGSNRYDFWRVGLIEFKKHPLQGIGTDNFLVPYLKIGHSNEEPVYPHSLVVDLLSQTGLIGTVLFVGFLALTLLVILRMRSGRDRELACVLAVGASVWMYHSLVDWLWEMPALGVLGMALLGAACGLAPRRRQPKPAPRVAVRVALAACLTVLTVAMALALALPWLAQRDIQQAENVWSSQPSTAFSLLQSASGLNPLDDQADVIGGAIASRLHRFTVMRSYFGSALNRSPDDWYAALELGIAASLTDRSALAASSLRLAVALDPREPIVRSVAHTFASGGRINSDTVNAEFDAMS